MDSFIQKKKEFFANKCDATYQAMAEAFRNLVVNGTWVRFPCENELDGALKYATIIHNSKHYVAMFTSDETVKLRAGVDIIMTDINKGIDDIFDNPFFRGLAVDPFSENSLYLELPHLEFFSGKQNPRDQQRDWGEGIPKYTPHDLMSKEELLVFGLTVINGYLLQNGYEVLEINDALNQDANVVTKKDGELIFIKVKAQIADPQNKLGNKVTTPTITIEEHEAALKFAREFNGKAMFAAISFGSKDNQRFMEGLGLYGDGYLVKFNGLEEL